MSASGGETDAECLRELLRLALACEGNEANWRDRARAALAAMPDRGAAEPSPFDGHCCTPKPGEPFFVLLGRDAQAASLVQRWADEREERKLGDGKIDGARQIAADMRAFNPASLAAPPAADQIRAEERKACARIADEMAPFTGTAGTVFEQGCRSAAQAIAAAIRARKGEQ